MRAFLFFILLLVISLCLPSTAFAQEVLLTDNTTHEVTAVGTITDSIPADLDPFQFPQVTFFLQGGDGGRTATDGNTGRGGDGARVAVTFNLGTGDEDLKPGGLIRFVVGGVGENRGNIGGAGGGGGTAILYKDPGVNRANQGFPGTGLANSGQNGWTMLAVAGGGGGGYANANGKSDGRAGNDTTNGSDGRSTNGNSNAGGQNGNAGVSQQSGAGAGYREGAGNAPAGRLGGGSGSSVAGRVGGYGFAGGGHGVSDHGGGGGGGYSGGGAGRNSGSAGGGGGSFASSSSTITSIIQRDDTNSPVDGYISYRFIEDLTPGPLPIPACVDEIDVFLDDAEEVTLTGLDLDDGSINPMDGTLGYFVCTSADQVNFGCNSTITFDCGDVGDNRIVYLGVQNTSGFSYCSTETLIRVRTGTGKAPSCPTDVTVDLTTGCSTVLSSNQLAPVSTGDCTDPNVGLTLPDLTTESLTFSALTSYNFVSGTTQVEYTNSEGSCTYSVTVNPGSPTVLNCSSNRTFDLNNNIDCTRSVSSGSLDLDYDGPGTISYRITGSNVLDPTITTGDGQIPSQNLRRGITTFEYFVNEPGGCFSTCSFTIELTRDLNSNFRFVELTCPDEISLPYTEETTEADIYRAVITDINNQCDILTEVTINDLDLSCNALGELQGNVVIRGFLNDYSGTCRVDITLVDTIPPTAICADREISLLQNGTFTFGNPTFMAFNSVNSCGTADGLIFTPDLQVFTCEELGAAEYKTVVTNGSGLKDSCYATITVVDTRRPIVQCQNRTLILGSDGFAFLFAPDLDNGSSDNCEIVSFDADRTVFNCDDLGANTVSMTATDNSGNIRSCTSTVTIIDPNGFCTLLPLNLMTFTGRTEGKTNILEWTTAQEEGFSHFTVERSVDGATWQDLGAVAGVGEIEGAMDYGFVDNDPTAIAYYRLRMIDLDGSFSYSNVVQLKSEVLATSLHVLPNPNTGAFQLALPDVNEAMDLAIYTIHGTRVRAQKIGSGTAYWQTRAPLASGVYLATISTAAGQRWTQRVIVR